jgi:hypothetical protein
MCCVLCWRRRARPCAVARGYEFRDVDEGLTHNHVEAALVGQAGTLTIVAMMAFCSCFARRVKRPRQTRKSLFSHLPATVHGVVFAFFVWKLRARAARRNAGRSKRGNAIAKSGAAANHAARMRRTNKQSQAAR